jgi:uncharacterized membrane protein YwaF
MAQKETWLSALRVTFCRINDYVSNYVQYEYTKLQKLPLDVSDSIIRLQSVQMGVLIRPDKILENI